MLFQFRAFIKFLWHSKNEHAVHSPFVFSLITKCFYDKKNHGSYFILNQYRNNLLKNKNTIEVTDFGAGSRVFKSNTRRIDKIAINAGITRKRAKLLFRIVNYFQPETILEIGTSLGLATVALSNGNKNGNITSLEGCPQTATIAKNQFKEFQLKNIEVVVGEFQGFLNSNHLSSYNFSLIYFDGNHSKNATLDYFEKLLTTTTNESVWIFDDIHWSQEMEEAWELIKKHPKVTVTIDTFQWGFVFFRREQAKEHFIIRV